MIKFSPAFGANYVERPISVYKVAADETISPVTDKASVSKTLKAAKTDNTDSMKQAQKFKKLMSRPENKRFYTQVLPSSVEIVLNRDVFDRTELGEGIIFDSSVEVVQTKGSGNRIFGVDEILADKKPDKSFGSWLRSLKTAFLAPKRYY